MGLDRGETDDQFCGDGPIAGPSRQQAQHLTLAGGKVAPVSGTDSAFGVCPWASIVMGLVAD